MDEFKKGLVKDLYISLIKESYLFKGELSFSDIAKTSIDAADNLIYEINKNAINENPELEIYDKNKRYVELTKVIHYGDVYFVRGVNSLSNP